MSFDSPFLFCNVFRQETNGIRPLVQSIVAKPLAFTSTASGVVIFPNITVYRTMSTFGGGQHISTITTIDKQLFDGFDHIAKAIGLSLTDKNQIPQIIAKLKEYGIIDDVTYFKILDSLLTFDGLLSQVSQEGKLLIGDFDAMRNALTLLAGLKLNLSPNGTTVEYDENKMASSSYFGLSETTRDSCGYMNYLDSTLSTSLSTLMPSSNADFIKSSG